MKNPWDKDEGTIVIHSDEVTEQWDTKEIASSKKKDTLPRPSQERSQTKSPPTEKVLEDVGRAIDDTINRLSSTRGSDLPSVLEASDLTSPQGYNLGELLLTTTKLTREQLDEA